MAAMPTFDLSDIDAYAVISAPARVSALKSVVLPAFGRPTIPTSRATRSSFQGDIRRRGVMGACNARTQGAPILGVSGRLRRGSAGAQRVPAAQDVILK